MENELVVLRACGFSQRSLAKPALLTAVAFSLLLMAFSAYITPKCIAAVQLLRQEVKTQYSAFLLREGVFNTFGSNLTIYLRARDKNGEMRGIVIQDTRAKDKPPVTILAKRGRIAMDSGVPTIIVSDGIRQQAENAEGAMSKLYFSRYAIEIKGLEGAVEQRWKSGNERTLWELFHPDPGNARDRENADLFLAEAHSRIVEPWNTLSFAAVALAFVLIGPFNRRGQTPRILAGAVTVALLQTGSMIFANLSKGSLAFVPLMYINTFLPAGLALYALRPEAEQTLAQLASHAGRFLERRGARARGAA